jgi:hypothetical protein
MMNSRFFLAPLILALLFAGTRSTYAQAEKESGVKEAMRQKVAYSQQVLVGITLEDYGLIANNAEKLWNSAIKRTGIRAKCRNTSYSSTNSAATPRS